MREHEALFIISVAARLVDMHPSTLRKYERVGFLEPSRLGGKLRLYSPDDITRLRQIKYLVEERGVNLAGIELALEVTEGLLRLRETLGVRDGGPDSRVDALRLAIVDDLLDQVGVAPEEPEKRTSSPRRQSRGAENEPESRVGGRAR